MDSHLAARPEFVHLHAVETFNGQVNPAELAQAEDLARILGLPAVGGSDAHTTAQVGVMVTEFARPVADEMQFARGDSRGSHPPAEDAVGPRFSAT